MAKKDEEELPFAEGLSSLGKALSAKQEAETTLESLSTIANAAETWMKVRARNQDIQKEKIEVKTPKGSSLSELENYSNVLNGKSNVTEFFGKDSDISFNYFKESSVLNPEDPVQSLIGANFQVNTISLSDVTENTQYKQFTDQYQSKFAEAIKQSEEQTQQPVTPNQPNAKAQQKTVSLADQADDRMKSKEVSAEEISKDTTTKSEEPDTKVEEVEVPKAGATEQTDNIEVEEVSTTDTPSENVTDKLDDILDKNKMKGGLLGKAR